MGQYKEFLSREVAAVLELPYDRRQGKAWEITKTILKVVTDALNRGEDVQIHGFGIFKVKPRKGGNRLCYFYPYLKKKGLHKEIRPNKPGRRVMFSPSKVLKRLLNPPITQE